jgi:TatD DNase family protein
MQWFDTHCHFNHPDFLGQEKEVWKRAQDAGVKNTVIIGYDLKSSRRAVELLDELDDVYAAVGVSPHEILTTPDGYIEELRALAKHPKVAAIGEAGLEYHYPVGKHDVQQREFMNQARLADELDKPLVIHLRDGDEDFLRLWEESPPKNAILHCFTASEAVMQKAVSLGHYISFSGILTFKKSTGLHAIASKVPAENILIETDAPYLAPTPHRGKPCEPVMVIHTGTFLGNLRGWSEVETAKVTFENALRVFQLKHD